MKNVYVIFKYVINVIILKYISTSIDVEFKYIKVKTKNIIHFTK